MQTFTLEDSDLDLISSAGTLPCRWATTAICDSQIFHAAPSRTAWTPHVDAVIKRPVSGYPALDRLDRWDNRQAGGLGRWCTLTSHWQAQFGEHRRTWLWDSAKTVAHGLSSGSSVDSRIYVRLSLRNPYVLIYLVSVIFLMNSAEIGCTGLVIAMLLELTKLDGCDAGSNRDVMPHICPWKRLESDSWINLLVTPSRTPSEAARDDYASSTHHNTLALLAVIIECAWIHATGVNLVNNLATPGISSTCSCCRRQHRSALLTKFELTLRSRRGAHSARDLYSSAGQCCAPRLHEG